MITGPMVEIEEEMETAYRVTKVDRFSIIPFWGASFHLRQVFSKELMLVL